MEVPRSLVGSGVEGGPPTESIAIPVIVSGGVATTEDVVRAAHHRNQGICGVIVGRAIYTGDVDLSLALRQVEAV